MTLTEDRIRRDLDALAPAPPPDLFALAAVGRAVARHRRRRRAAAAGVAAVAVAVVLGGPAMATRGRPSDVAMPAATTGPAPTPPAPPPTPVPTSAAPASPPPSDAGPPASVATTLPPADTAPAAAAGPAVRFANARFRLPVGWAVVEQDSGHLCVAPAGNPAPRWDGCGGLMLHHGLLPGFEDQPYQDHGPWAWYHHTDVDPCPNGPDPAPGQPLDGVIGDDAVAPPGGDPYGPIDSGFQDVGDRVAVYDQWAARCQLSGFTFTPRAWHLPASQIVIFDVMGRAETRSILASFSFD